MVSGGIDDVLKAVELIIAKLLSEVVIVTYGWSI
jgi:hypothetical protein